jgi:hypothetical protein
MYLVVPLQPEVGLFGPVDTFLAPVLEYVLLVLVLANMGARAAEYSQHRRQAREGADAITRHPARVATTMLLIVLSFYLATVSYEAGLVTSTLVVGLAITDLFEFESRKVEARRDIPLEQPKGAIAASVFVLLYVAYNALFFLVADLWNAVV